MTAEEIIHYGYENGLIKRRCALKLLNIAKYGELRCELCGKPIGKGKTLKFSIDHIIPLSKGGPNNLNNLQVSHSRCNNEKGNSIPEGAGHGINTQSA